VKEKIKKVLGIIKNLPATGKIGFILWITGFPIGFSGIILLGMGAVLIGTFLFFLPWITGNLGMILMGKEVVKSVRKEFSRKKIKSSKKS